jgi:prepilin-type N-terminal cleavage/methylation domain-containing protein
MKSLKTSSLSAFSLVELSIVLVILGLLAGGVLSGQALIRAAELRSVTTDYQRYTAATVAFRDKYIALPGDMLNATKYWSAAHATAATCITTASTSKATCNGNGDGNINYETDADFGYESSRAWQHLANAGLIEGSYSGITPGTPVPGVNYPATKLSRGVWAMWTLPGRATWGWAPKESGVNIAVGSITGPNPNRWLNAILKPEEAWSIDKKIDDGMPFIGKANDIMSAGTDSYTPNCAVTDTSETSEYKLSDSSISCLLIISVF